MQVSETPSSKHRNNSHKNKPSKGSTNNNNSADNNKSKTSGSGNVVGVTSTRKTSKDNDDKSPSVMSQMNDHYMSLDDDHIDDKESINVGNLIIDLESDLEREIEQAKSKPSNSNQSANQPSSSSSASGPYAQKASFSTSFHAGSSPSAPKSNQKPSNKHSNIASLNNVTSNSSNSTTHNIMNSTSTSGSGNASCSNNVGSNNGHLSTRAVFKSSADEKCELKMKITRETKPGKSEHKIVTSPNQKSPISSSVGNPSASNYMTNCDESLLPNLNSTQSSSISSTKECGTSTSIGTITEPDCLGPCEPGTSVTLEGIVWQETDGGILVVNVTWRGKTYVGALLDCTKHDWAPPRLCDSPASDIDSKTHKGVRPKRIVTRSNGIGLDEKNLLQTTGKLRNGKGRRILTSNDPTCSKRQRESDKSNENIAAQTDANVPSITNSEIACVPMNVDTAPSMNNETISTSNILVDKAGPNSPTMIGCNEPNCSKKYRNMNGLLYHQTHAHGADNDSNHAQDNNCSSTSAKDKVKLANKGQSEDQEETHKSDCISPANANQSLASDVNTKQNQETNRQRTPSPHQSASMNDKEGREFPENNIINKNHADMMIDANMPTGSFNNPIPSSEPRPKLENVVEFDRRSSSNPNQTISNMDHSRRSPHVLSRPPEHGHGSNNHSSSKINAGNSKQSNSIPLPAAPPEEGMKPSGTSTGPPPAPHQANCYFNPAFLANTFNPYSMGPYFPTRSPLPLYDPLAPATSSTNALLTRFMSNMRVPPPPDSPSRLLSPSMGKNLPFTNFKVDPRQPHPMPIPTSLPQMTNPLPNMNPMTNPPPPAPMAAGSPLLRMPSHGGDPMLPPTSQPPFPHPVGLNPALGLPGSINPMEPLGGLQVPSLVEDPLAKHFPRRFNP